jgi:hypothetical protein
MLFETKPEQAIAIKLSCSLITTVVVLKRGKIMTATLAEKDALFHPLTSVRVISSM